VLRVTADTNILVSAIPNEMEDVLRRKFDWTAEEIAEAAGGSSPMLGQ
jgi:hypothetical protein